MKKTAGLVLFMAISIISVGQEIKAKYFNIEKLIDSTDYPVIKNCDKMFVYNDTLININKIGVNNIKEYTLLINNKIMDTIPKNLLGFNIYSKKYNSVFFANMRIDYHPYAEYTLINQFDLNNFKISRIDSLPDINISSSLYKNDFIIYKSPLTNENVSEIFIYNIETKQKKLLVKFDKEDFKIKENDIIYVFTINNSDKILIERAYTREGEWYNYNHYIYDTSAKTIFYTPIDPNLKKYNTVMSINFELINSDRTYCSAGHRLFDNEFNFKGYMLINNITKKGYNIQNNKIVSYFVSSYVGWNYNERKVIPKELHKYRNGTIIPYRFVYELERNMYFIKNDTIVDEKDLKNMEQTDLKILRNMIYAKHGYIFKSHYLVLLFKLYQFYKPLIINKSEVESMFTEQDKLNLKLIDKYILDINLNTFTKEQIIEAKEIVSYIDTLSGYIITDNNTKYNEYLNKLKDKINISNTVNKELLKNIYLNYGKELLAENKKINPEKFHYKVRNIANSLSAIYGYEFGNKKWLKIYKLFNWYKPQTKVPDFEFSVKILIEKLIHYDKNKK